MNVLDRMKLKGLICDYVLQDMYLPRLVVYFKFNERKYYISFEYIDNVILHSHSELERIIKDKIIEYINNMVI